MVEDHRKKAESGVLCFHTLLVQPYIMSSFKDSHLSKTTGEAAEQYWAFSLSGNSNFLQTGFHVFFNQILSGSDSFYP